MATFTVRLPDGAEYDVEAPEGTTDVQAYNYAMTSLPPETTIGG